VTPQRNSSFTNRFTSHLVSYSSLILIGLLISVPLAWFVITSFKPQEEYMSYPVQFFPRHLYLETYRAALTMIDYFRFAGHSVILSLTHTTLTVITSAMAGFAFARFNVPARNKLFVIVVAMLIVPAIIMQIPQFIIFSKLGLTGTWWPWVLWGLAASPFFIFLFRQFFAAFPRELEDAAEIDGCGPFRTFLFVFLPNSKPVLATAFILNFTAQWGDYINPFLFLKDSNTTLAVKLQTGYLSPQGQTLTTIILAAAVLYVLPVVIIFFLGQKHILEGVVTTGLKG
jgi:ABC-type glycerol-3-phosphate transport system permease component